ncbi:MAG: hypothetical protein HWE34_01975 [Methylocystaceae bacterium]|nr:hypothetical protein [Methylocystaceae bacterium]
MCQQLFHTMQLPFPDSLQNWKNRVNAWCAAYKATHGNSDIHEIHIDSAVFLFDLYFERVVLAYAISTPPLMKRDTNRMRGFPNVNASTTFFADKGHFLGHASGGQLDMNLFPHRRELNRGWSQEGKKFREMERFVEKNNNTFFFHHPLYDDLTWVPNQLEYGVLMESTNWWEDCFQNK